MVVMVTADFSFLVNYNKLGTSGVAGTHLDHCTGFAPLESKGVGK